MELVHRTINNAFFNSLSWALPVILNFFLTPFIVHKLGTDAYGILTLIWTIIGYFALLDLGLGNAVIKYIAEYNAEGNLRKISDVIGTTLLIFIVLGLIGGLALLSIAKFLVTKFLKIPPELFSSAHIAFCLGSIGFLLTMFLSVFSAIPDGMNRFDLSSIISVSMGTCTMVGTALVLYLGFGLITIVILMIVISFVGIVAYVFIAKYLLPEIRFMPVLKFSAMKKIMKFGIYSLLSRISYLINFQADRLITGAILGISWVTYYVVPFLLINRITEIIIRIGIVIFPAISELQGYKRYDTISNLYIISSRVIMAIASAICLPLLIFGSRLLTLWIGPDFGQKSSVVLLMLTLAIYLSSLTNIPTHIVNGLGRPKLSGLASLCNAMLNLALVIPLAKHMGINGVALAFLISNLCITPIFILYVNCKIVRMPIITLLKDAYAKPILAGFLMIIPLIFIPQNQINSLSILMGLIFSTAIVYLLISNIIGVFPQQEKAALISYLRLVLRKL